MDEQVGGRQSPSLARRAVAVGLVILTLVLWAGGAALAVLDGKGPAALPGLSAVGFAAVGALLVWQRPGHRLGPLLGAGALAMTVLGSAGAYAHHALVREPGSLPAGRTVAWLADSVAIPTIGLFAGLLPQLFPTGRPLSRRWRLPVWAALAFVLLGTVGNALMPEQLESVPTLRNPYAVPGLEPVLVGCVQLSAVCGVVALVGGAASLVARWRRAQADERQQLKWLAAGLALLPVPLVLHDTAPAFGDAVISVALLLIAAALGTAVTRHRLYDLDLVVRRALLYATVSGLVASVYVVVVAGAELATGQGVPLAVHVAVAVVVAAAFQPMRGRVQRAIDRLFYGDRTRPYDAVSRLARRLEAAVVPESVLPGVVETIAEALRVPFAAIDLREGEAWVRAAAHGVAAGTPESFAMVYQGEQVGRLLVCPRATEPALGPADRALLTDLARQAGVAAQAVRTTTALLRSRTELVTSREEERRRLRRDLHDGLGPTLAGVTLGLHAAQSHVRSRPEEAERLLVSLEQQVEEAVADVRRLVYDLRPPALDEFGLVRALQLHATRLESGGLDIAVESPAEGLGRLPAAVEVAAYRIASEAMTNVARHAHARSCVVRFSLNGALELEVADDGRGLAPTAASGVGLTSMRERAAELGGTLVVDSTGAGTRVLARLPATMPS